MTKLLIPGRVPNHALGIVVLVVLYFTSQNFLLFHSLVEMFSIVIACGIFMVAWNARRYFDNNYLLFIGIAYLFVGGLDFIHTLAYKGMGVFPWADTNLPAQLWIAARYTESLSFLAAPFFFRGKLKAHFVFLAYIVVCFLLLMAIFHWKVFPTCFVEGAGLTTFKKVSEYVISLVLLASIPLILRHRERFDGGVLGLVLWSITLTIASELAFTFYIHAYGFSNWVGHVLKIISFYLIYKAVIEVGLTRPYDFLFRGLKQNEEALRESEGRYRALVELSPDGIAVHREGTFVYLNAAGASLFGAATPQEVIGRDVLDLVHTDFRGLVTERMRQATQGADQLPRRHLRMLRCNGEAVDIEAVGVAITYEGKPSVLSILRDITERRKAEEERERWIVRLSSLVQVGADAIAAQSRQEMLDRVVCAARLVSRAKMGISGHGYSNGRFHVGATSKSEDAPWCPPSSLFEMERGGVYMDLMEGKNTVRLTDEELQSHPHWWGLPEGHASLRGLLGARLVGAGNETRGLIMVSQSEEGEFTREDELLLRQLAYLASMGLQHLEAREALGRARDDLELQVRERTADLARANAALQVENMVRKKAEEVLKTYNARLEQSNRDLEEFAFVASHDLQEPLRKIQVFGDRLRAKWWNTLDEQGRDYLERMQKAVQRMQTLIRDLLHFSRVSTSTNPLSAVDLTHLTHEVVDDLEAIIEQAGARVEIHDLASVEADAGLMRQLLQNLIGNAVKYHGEEAPKVKVYGSGPASGPGGSALYRVYVEDNGIGFDEKYVERIFKPFQRLHGRDEYEGTGMGLAICRRIVERHNGSITAKSAPGKGTTFVVTLPCKQPEGQIPSGKCAETRQ